MEGMKGVNRKRVLLVSGAIILLCIAIMFGMTFALFTDRETVNTHLKAGYLDITLKRTKLVSTSLDNNTGFLKTETDENIKDFSNTDDNVFDITKNTKIVPGCEYAADMLIENNSDVAFKYWIGVVYNGDKELELANQLEVSLTTDETVFANVSESMQFGDATHYVGLLQKGQSETFSVALKFPHLVNGDNNLAQTQELDFDIVVYAIQVTDAPAE